MVLNCTHIRAIVRRTRHRGGDEEAYHVYPGWLSKKKMCLQKGSLNKCFLIMPTNLMAILSEKGKRNWEGIIRKFQINKDFMAASLYLTANNTMLLQTARHICRIQLCPGYENITTWWWKAEGLRDLLWACNKHQAIKGSPAGRRSSRLWWLPAPILAARNTQRACRSSRGMKTPSPRCKRGNFFLPT